jgi:hypothetical protein
MITSIGRAVIDGSQVPSGDGPPLFGRPYAGLLSLLNCSHVVVANLELRNATACNGSNVVIDPRSDWFGADRGMCGSGIAVLEGKNVVVEDVHVHHVWNWGWGGTGDALTVRNSTFHDLQMCNENRNGDCQRCLGKGHQGWGQGLATGEWALSESSPYQVHIVPKLYPPLVTLGTQLQGVRCKDCALSSAITIEDNLIYRSWGEAVDPLMAEYVTIRGNEIRNR